MSTARRNCSVDGCDRVHWSRGWCLAHYKRWWKHGDPGGALPIRAGDAMARFMQRVDASGDCWLWTGPTVNGYGDFRAERRHHKAHRWLYEQQVGPIPDRLDLDHLCRVRHCVRPDHLEPVTRAENLRRGAAARRLEAS